MLGLQLLVLWVSSQQLSSSVAGCYQYEHDTIAVRGTVVRRVYPGRPNYASVKRGDEPDTVYVLRLRTPLCTAKSDAGEAREKVEEVQLYFSMTEASAVKRMNGKKVLLHGTLEEWKLGWHHLPVLLHVRSEKGTGVTRSAV